MRRSKSLKVKLILSFATVSSTFVALLGLTSYLLYSNNVIKISNQQIISSNEQSLANYESYFDNVISVSSSVQSKLENIDLKAKPKEAVEYFDDIMSLNKEIKSIAIYELGTSDVLGHSSKWIEVENPSSKEWFNKSKENPLINIFSSVSQVEDNAYSFSLSKYVSFNKGIGQAILKVDYDFNKMIDLIEKTNLGKGGHITIYDKNYNVVFCSTPYKYEELDTVKNLVLGYEVVSYDGAKYSLYLSTISKTSWKVAIFTNYSTITGVINAFILTIVFSAIGLSVLFILVIYLISSQITRPIRLLQLEMAKVASLNYNVSDLKRIYGSKEVEDLSKSFNKMMYRIKELAEQLLVEEDNKRISELKALQNQINPHFLYNTLDSIVYLIDNDEKEKASEMIIALSKFFRISISKGRNVIPLSKEVEHVRNYLLIQKIRFGKQFEYTIDVDPRLDNIPVIKLILQPIVENSIIHGFNELEYVGRIDITGKIENDLIRFDIRDNGYGILPEKIEEIYKSFKDDSVQEGVGFKNVYQRLILYYGPKADIKIESDLDCGTDVIIFIPLDGGKANAKK